MSQSDQEALTPFKLAEEIFRDAWPWWKTKFEASDELLRFLSGARYVDDNGQFNKDRRGVQIRGQEIADTIRHGVAKVMEKSRAVEARPRDVGGQWDEAGEIMVGLVGDELSDPYKGFERERYAAVQMAKEARRGVVWMDWVKDFGAFGGEMMYSFQPNGTLMWDQAYHPHHPLCGWLIRHKRIDYRQANRIYGVDWLKPDREQLTADRSTFRAGIPLFQGFTDRIATLAVRDKRVTIREVWIKNDPTVDPEKPDIEQQHQVLEKPQRYLQCASQCGYRSRTQGELKAAGKLKGNLPESLPPAAEDQQGGCPVCGGGLERIDAKAATQQQLMYAKGRRLIITAPFSPGPGDQEELYDGNWPIPSVRSFPAYFVFGSVKPGDSSGGMCDTDWMWDQQVASDNLMTLAVQRVFEHRDYWEMPTIGFYNNRGDRFEFRDDDENVIFRDLTKTRDYGPVAIQHIAGTGLDPGWAPVYERIQNALLAFRPKADIGIQAGETQNIAVGTAEIIQQQGEVPNDDFKRRDHLELSMFYGPVEDYIRATYTPDRLARLNIDGGDHLLQLWGDALPSFDYVVSDTPDFTGVQQDKAKAWDAAMMAASQFGPEILDSWGKFHNIPQTVIRDLQKFFAQKQAEQQAQMAAMGGGLAGPTIGAPPGMAPGPGGPNGPPPMNPNGAGAVPTPVG